MASSTNSDTKKILNDGKDSSVKRVKKKYVCTGFEGCSMVFTRSENLTRHRRKHTGEKPFGCHVCFRFFSRIDNLKQHIESVHGKELLVVNKKKRRLNNAKHDTFTNLTLVPGTHNTSAITATSINPYKQLNILNSNIGNHLPQNNYGNVTTSTSYGHPQKNLSSSEHVYYPQTDYYSNGSSLPTPPEMPKSEIVFQVNGTQPAQHLLAPVSPSLSPAANHPQYTRFENMSTRMLPLPPVHAHKKPTVISEEIATTPKQLDGKVTYAYQQPALFQETSTMQMVPAQPHILVQSRLPKIINSQAPVDTQLRYNREYTSSGMIPSVSQTIGTASYPIQTISQAPAVYQHTNPQPQQYYIQTMNDKRIQQGQPNHITPFNSTSITTIYQPLSNTLQATYAHNQESVTTRITYK